MARRERDGEARRPGDTATPASAPPAPDPADAPVDLERLVWDPEYRAEILRRRRAESS